VNSPPFRLLPSSLTVLGLVCGWPCAPEFAAASEPTFNRDIRPLLETHCTGCHGLPDESPEAGLSLAAFDGRESVLKSRPTWKKVLDAVEGYEMPPEDTEQLSARQRGLLIGWIRSALAEPEVGEMHDPGRPVLRRLTRLEYNNTVRDLLGLDTDLFMFPERLPFDKSYFDPAAERMPERLRIPAREYGAKYPVLLPQAGLPGDSRAEHGFSNRGDAQSLSAVRLEQYLELAERIAFHPELLSRAERLQELFPNAKYEPQRPETRTRLAQQIVNAEDEIAPNGNVHRTAAGSAAPLDEFRQRVARAFEEDRGGVYDVSENANSVIPGKGGVLHLAYGTNSMRVFGVNPSEDVWNAAFATAEESSGGSLFTNKRPDQKTFFLDFHAVGDEPWSGIRELGVVVLSRRGQSGTVRLTAEFEGAASQSITVTLGEGAGADNTFVSFVAPDDKLIRRLVIDGSEFSGEYVVLDDLAFITDDPPADKAAIVGRELDETDTGPAPAAADRKIDLTIAQQPPRTRLAHFLGRAFRWPVEDAEVDLYFQLYETIRAEGGNDETAIRTALQAILASPRFLYLSESGQVDAGDSPIVPLTDYELANRLSYFLWSSMPDDELLKLAAEGRLQDVQVLEAQVRRMLQDRRVRELSENFFVEWLRLRELWSAQPDRRLFNDFYDGPQGKRTLAPDMFAEALLLFERILIEDRSITELIDTDSTYVNDRLAKLYKLDVATGSDKDWQRVELDDPNRGGMLTMAAPLTLTSFPHRTSPIKRGAWFLETVFNRPPPPPKVAVADIDEQDNADDTLTFREKVQRHRDTAACAVCHNRIDPPGFALENFDAIGAWSS